ncbi:hypothetical protein C0J52_18733, partial [Blattella germanica]
FRINSSHPAFHASSISPSLHRSSKTFSTIRNKFQVKFVLQFYQIEDGDMANNAYYFSIATHIASSLSDI